MAVAKAERLKLTIHAGHKGPAFVFPFDPAKKWGKRDRQFVAGTINGVRFEGEIGFRRRAFYTLLDDELLSAAAVHEGEEVDVVVSPREGSEADLRTPANLVWCRLATQQSTRQNDKALLPASQARRRRS